MPSPYPLTRRGIPLSRGRPLHSIGRRIHGQPHFPNYDARGFEQLLTDGLVSTIEPVIAAGSGTVRSTRDGWTIKTTDGGYAADSERTIVVTDGAAIVLTARSSRLATTSLGAPALVLSLLLFIYDARERQSRMQPGPATMRHPSGVNAKQLEREGVALFYYEFGGTGPPMLLLHGLAGYAGEWAQSAELLCADYRVFALDQRGHGESTRCPRDLSRDAFVEDCAATIRRIGLGPVTLVGQSMGASTAMLTAAAHPDLVRTLVIIEGSPDGPDRPDPDPEAAHQIEASLGAWPIPFPDKASAQRFFESNGLDPDAWTAGLQTRSDGLWPRWDLDALVACMADLHSRNYWPQWQAIRAPTLVILGEHGIFPAEHGQEIVRRLPGSTLLTVSNAGHDVHLDAPAAWVEGLRRSPAH